MEVFGSAQKMVKREALTTNKHAPTFTTNFFLEPPYYESINLQEFEAYAIERLKVLRAFENVAFKSPRGSPEYAEAIIKDINKDLRYRYIRPLTITSEDVLLENKRRDVLSHFILRMVFCRNEEQKRWFIQQEVDLFRFRLSQEDASTISLFLKESNLDYTPLPDEEYRNIRPILEKSTYHYNNSQAIADTEFYKIDFLEALDSVRQRKVYLSQGWAYVPRRLLLDVVCGRYRDHLAMELSKLSRVIADSQEENRLIPVLNSLASGYTGSSYSAGEFEFGITVDNLDQLSNESFPLCAKNMHEHLRKDHHLKHHARLQYGLYLKGIGLSMDDEMKLYRTEFMKGGMTDKAFKQHEYGVRHMYGKEGRRVNYTPYSCIKIITGNPPGPDDHHGCPFRHFNPSLLQQRLKSYGVPPKGVEEVISLVSRGHYQIACTKYFEITHKEKLENALVESIQHPNQYFEESRRLLHPETVKETQSTFLRKPAEPVNVMQNSSTAQRAYSGPAGPVSSFDETADDFLGDIDLDAALLDAETSQATTSNSMNTDPSNGQQRAA
ncbi:hypothetical protein RvY_12979 [Ramazzottius varieornatus]|uniref:DNA primase large subunit n=1 Tax=Ramazzottius varieornatus TaxID=947166 RepID=A0A1D1VUY8_RAMVA|nr:hypothetical protein RvY_12979 [Ramazzottius varieornatus]